MTEKLPAKETVILTGNGAESSAHGSHPVSILDKETPRSLYQVSSKAVQKVLDKSEVTDLLSKEETDLQKLIKPNKTINRLRIAFWKEFDHAQNHKCKMNMANVYRGICTQEYFSMVLSDENVRNAVWILLPRTNYAIVMEEALDKANERLREIIEMPIYEMKQIKGKDGKVRQKRVPNAKIAEIILKAQKALDERVKGAVVQKVEQKSLNYSVNEQRKEGVITDIEVNAEIIEAEIRELEKENQNKVSPDINPYKEDAIDSAIEAAARTLGKATGTEKT